jgi:hypothetical protein
MDDKGSTKWSPKNVHSGRIPQNPYIGHLPDRLFRLAAGLITLYDITNQYKNNMIYHILILYIYHILIYYIYILYMRNVKPIVSWVCLGGSHLEMSQASVKHVPGIIHVKGHGPRQIQIHTCELSCNTAGRVMLLKS